MRNAAKPAKHIKAVSLYLVSIAYIIFMKILKLLCNSLNNFRMSVNLRFTWERKFVKRCPRSICDPSVAHRKIVTFFFFFNDTATTEIYTLSLHDALPI